MQEIKTSKRFVVTTPREKNTEGARRGRETNQTTITTDFFEREKGQSEGGREALDGLQF